MWKIFALSLAIPVILAAQAGPRGARGGMFREWWDSPMAEGLNLTDAQRKQIQDTIREYRNRLVDARAAVEKAEGDLEDYFNAENGIDQRKASEAIDHLANARAELTRVISQMSLRLRAVLTNQQWAELRKRGGGRGPVPFDSKVGPRSGGRRFGNPAPGAGQQQPNPPPQPAPAPNPARPPA
jgi:Spy/CpxP family protein refolding chaperone